MKLHLIRHGESQGNREARLQGRREYPLTDDGVRQCEALASRLARASLSAIYASPIRRAMHTAEILASAAGIDPQSDERLQEYDFGDLLSGLTWQEIRQQHPGLIASILAGGPDFPEYPGEEGRDTFSQRVSHALSEIIARHRGDDAVAVVTHAGPITVHLMQFLGRPYSRPIPFTIDNTSVTIIDYAPARPDAVLHALNDTCHLRPQ